MNNYDEALLYYKKGYLLHELNVNNDQNEEIMKSINNISCIYMITKQYHELLSLYTVGLEVRNRHYGEDHIETILYVKKIGDLYFQTHQSQDAIIYYKKCYNYKMIFIEKKNYSDLVNIINNLITLYENDSKYEETVPLYYELYFIYMETYGCTHANTKDVLSKLCELYESLQQVQECIKLYSMYIESYNKTYLETDEDVLSMMNNLANIYYDLEMYEDAYSQYNKCVNCCFEIFGEYDTNILIVLDNLIDLSLHTKRDEEAIILVRFICQNIIKNIWRE